MILPTRHAWFGLGVACAVIWSLVAPVAASPNEPTLDELLDLPPSATPAGPRRIPDDPLTPPPGQAKAKGGAEEFLHVVSNMEQAAQRLDRLSDAGIDTQRLQQKVLTLLDQLIAQAQQQQGGQSGGTPKPQDQGTEGSQSRPTPGSNQGGQQSNQGGGGTPGGSRGDDRLGQRLGLWGNLPPRLRDQLLQGLEDRFSSLYQNLTEQYYQRLAEENP